MNTNGQLVRLAVARSRNVWAYYAALEVACYASSARSSSGVIDVPGGGLIALSAKCRSDQQRGDMLVGVRAGDASDREAPGSATGEWGTGWGQRSGLSCVPHMVHAHAVHSNWEAPSGFCRVPRGCGNTAGTHRGEARCRFSPRNADPVRPLHFLQEMPAENTWATLSANQLGVPHPASSSASVGKWSSTAGRKCRR